MHLMTEASASAIRATIRRPDKVFWCSISKRATQMRAREASTAVLLTEQCRRIQPVGPSEPRYRPKYIHDTCIPACKYTVVSPGLPKSGSRQAGWAGGNAQLCQGRHGKSQDNKNRVPQVGGAHPVCHHARCVFKFNRVQDGLHTLYQSVERANGGCYIVIS